MFNSTYAVYELNKGIYRKLKKTKLNVYDMSMLQYGLHERKTFEIQSTWTKMSPIECLPSSINKLVWNRNRCCNIQEFNPNTGEDLLYKYFWCRVSLFSF